MKLFICADRRIKFLFNRAVKVNAQLYGARFLSVFDMGHHTVRVLYFCS